MPETIEISHRDRVSTITINRPPFNTVTPLVMAELQSAFAALETREETRCVVLTGAGTRAFCAGASLDDRPQDDPAASDAFRENGRALIDRIETFPKPVIAAIRGWCIGGGFAIAQACDVRLASQTAKFRTGDAYIGIVPSWGVSLVRLVHYIGRNRTLDMLILGEDIAAGEALGLGLVSRAIADDEFDAEIARIADRVSGGAPQVFQAIKSAVRSQCFESPPAAAHLETYWAATTRGSFDAKEGVAAFKEKRKPAFKGC
jgi:enoyl-CoA hydratase